MRKLYFLAYTLILLSAGTLHSQGDHPAFWIAHPDADPHEFGVYHYRKSFPLTGVPTVFTIEVSADNRYRLYVNGESVCLGPARGDMNHWRYETVDIAPYLRAGENTLAVQVSFAGGSFPVAQLFARPAFYLRGVAAAGGTVNSNASWKVIRNGAHSQISYDDLKWWQWAHGWYAAGGTDRIDGRDYPWGWETPDYDDEMWSWAEELSAAPWKLEPRPIPLLEEKIERFRSIRRSEGGEIHDGFLRGSSDLVIAPRSSVKLLLDMGYLTIGYPELRISGGARSNIKVTYAEALFDSNGKKGNRNEIEGREIEGYWDVFRPGAGQHRLYRPTWMRTYRYVQLELTTSSTPLTLHDYYSVFTAYPFERRASFDSGADSLAAIWDIGWLTSRCCAIETYVDCPYYEQLNYAGDSRVQALISLYLSGDDRLMKDAIRLLAVSMLPEGITQACYPLHPSKEITIPTYALFLISMLHDYYWHRADDAFLAEHTVTVQSILRWFSGYLDDSGLLADVDHWNFVDWSFEGGTPDGAVQGEGGRSTLLNLQYAYTLEQAADLFDHLGQPAQAVRWSQQADSVKSRVLEFCWDDSRGLFADTPEKTSFSQHSNIFAVLLHLLAPEQERGLLQKILAESGLTPASTYFKFYLFRALLETGLGDLFFNQLAVWHDMAGLGFSTFGETGLPQHDRSDCHAWSAHPIYYFLSLVCGVMPAEPGFKSVRIAPSLGPLNRVSGSVPHPAGDIVVQFERSSRALSGLVRLPEVLTGELIWGGERLPLKGGENRFDLSAAPDPTGWLDGPSQYRLEQNYPNPFNPNTHITYSVPVRSRVRISIFDVLGHNVKPLVDQLQSPGVYTVRWDGRDRGERPVANGIYFCRMAAGDYDDSVKLILAR